jgi:hypothetical protein
MTFLDTCFKSLVVLMVGAVAALAMAGSAQAATLKCPSDDLQSVFPAVYNLRAHNLPAKTDHYAPPCLVAEGGAGVIQFYAGEPGGRIPRSVRIMGARWYAGTWRVRYRTVNGDDSPYAKFTLTHGAQRITFDGTS